MHEVHALHCSTPCTARISIFRCAPVYSLAGKDIISSSSIMRSSAWIPSFAVPQVNFLAMLASLGCAGWRWCIPSRQLICSP